MVRRPRSPARSVRGGALDLDLIGRDRTSGASALSIRALRRLSTWAASAPLSGAEGGRRLAAAARSVRDAQPAMGAFRRWSTILSEIARRPEGRRRRVLRQVNAELRQLRRETTRVARTAARA